MARMSFLSRRRSEPPAPEPTEAAPAPHRRPLPPPARLRRERRTLLRVREERIRDLGGLVLEMYRRQGFRQDLVDEQCAELVSLEDRLHELDSLLAVSVSARHAAPAARCECGAPVLWGSHFCANCGRPHGDRPVVACASCGAAIPADAKFCASCGRPVATAEP
ncbi:MAG: zinc ribbon domain-containing protein [Actinobacteria bacterium]|nr:MAG: zinc ribbon domain-containing protein [Actinomycetota bacterium]